MPTKKEQAHGFIAKAKARGDVGEPTTMRCVIGCGAMATGFHHHSYEREHWLDVVAVCDSCHQNIHAGRVADPTTGVFWKPKRVSWRDGDLAREMRGLPPLE